MLAKTLRPQPDSYVIIDRQRASVNGFLVDPSVQRNTAALQHLLPSYVWVPRSARASWKSLANYRKMTPLQLGVDRHIQPGSTFPLYPLFGASPAVHVTTASTVVSGGNVNGQTITLTRQNLVVSTVPPG